MEIHERLAKLEADDKNIFPQLSEIKEEVKDIRRLTLAVEKIAVKTESIDSKVDNMGSRLHAVESEPAESFLHFKKLIIGAILTTTLTTLLASILSFVLR